MGRSSELEFLPLADGELGKDWLVMRAGVRIGKIIMRAYVTVTFNGALYHVDDLVTITEFASYLETGKQVPFAKLATRPIAGEKGQGE